MVSKNLVWILGGTNGLGHELAKKALFVGLSPMVFGVNSSPNRVDLKDGSSVFALCKKIDALVDAEIERVTCFIWNASVFEEAPFDSSTRFDEIIRVNVNGPIRIIKSFLARKKRAKSPFHLITISSRSSWKAWVDQAVYCGTKAFQAQFSRALALELERDLPGSKVSIVLPGGMKTGIFIGTSIDTSNFMDSGVVASMIWEEVLSQEKICDWFNIVSIDGAPAVSRENFSPELSLDNLPRLSN